jgi:hypothetical protein
MTTHRETALATLVAVAEDATAEASARVRAAELLLQLPPPVDTAKSGTQLSPTELEKRRREAFRDVVGMSSSRLVPRLGQDD